MIEKLVGKPLNLTEVENVKPESVSVAQNIPEKVAVSHSFQEAQFAKSQKSELAMFGSIHQMRIGVELERNPQAGATLVKGSPATNPTVQELLDKLKELKAQKQEIMSQLRQLQSELKNVDPKTDKNRFNELCLQINGLNTRLAEIEMDIMNVLTEIQFQQKKDEEEPEPMVINRKISLW